MTDAEIERTAPPELANIPKDFWKSAELVPTVLKEPISLRVDVDVLDWFRAQGPRYQSRMNAVLRTYMRATARSTKKHRASSRDAG
ncbi:MAG: BrnA antitoxin family protein [Gemmatimonadaceae bacterium]